MMAPNLLAPLASEIERLRRSLRPSATGFGRIARTILVAAGDAAYPSDLLWLDLDAADDARHDVLARSLLTARTVAWLGVHFAPAHVEAEWLVVSALIADAGRLRLERPILAADDRHHASLSAALAGGLTDAPACLARWVRNHHERSDGTGHPLGLGARGLSAEDRILIAATRFSELFADDAAAAAHQLHSEARGGAFDADLTANLVWSITGELPTDAGFDQAAPEPWPLTDFGRRRLRIDAGHRTLRGPHFSSTPSGLTRRGVLSRD